MKEAYYFSHDSNARHDLKITAMRGVYGSEGFGWFWILVEMMREQDDYKLDLQPKYAYHAFAKQMECDVATAKQYIQDCIAEFKLFQSDGSCFWSESLLRRMREKDRKSEKARQSANARWNKKPTPNKESSSDEIRTQSESNANASKNNAIKESKGKEIKEKEKKKKYAEFVFMTESEYQKLVDQYGPAYTDEMVSVLDNYKGSKGVKYKSDYRAIRSWVVEKVLDKHKTSVQQNKNNIAMQLLKEAQERERIGDHSAAYSFAEHV